MITSANLSGEPAAAQNRCGSVSGITLWEQTFVCEWSPLGRSLANRVLVVLISIN